MTKEELGSVLHGFMDLIYEWNQLGEEGTHHNALCLLVWEDGSGVIGTVGDEAPVLEKEIAVHCDFETIEQCTEYLFQWAE